MAYREINAKPEVPPLVKWLVGAIVGFGSTALIGLGFWLVTSVGQMQVTLARMDERQVAQVPHQTTRDAEQDRRITQLEAFHRQGGAMKWTSFLRRLDEGLEVTRITGFLSGLGLIGYTGYDVIWLQTGFDPLGFSAGVPAIVGGTGGAAAVKDRQVAISHVIKATASKPAKPPAPAPKV